MKKKIDTNCYPRGILWSRKISLFARDDKRKDQDDRK